MQPIMVAAVAAVLLFDLQAPVFDFELFIQHFAGLAAHGLTIGAGFDDDVN